MKKILVLMLLMFISIPQISGVAIIKDDVTGVEHYKTKSFYLANTRSGMYHSMMIKSFFITDDSTDKIFLAMQCVVSSSVGMWQISSENDNLIVTFEDGTSLKLDFKDEYIVKGNPTAIAVVDYDEFPRIVTVKLETEDGDTDFKISKKGASKVQKQFISIKKALADKENEDK